MDTWPNRLVLRLSLQSGHETNDPLKSGPAKAGPAGPATPPLLESKHLFWLLISKIGNIPILRTVYA